MLLQFIVSLEKEEPAPLFVASYFIPEGFQKLKML
jgi:hypothetical protein